MRQARLQVRTNTYYVSAPISFKQIILNSGESTESDIRKGKASTCKGQAKETKKTSKKNRKGNTGRKGKKRRKGGKAEMERYDIWLHCPKGQAKQRLP